MTERLYDKETIIRTHAVIALSRLIGSDEADEDGQTILQTLLETISTDPAAYVALSECLYLLEHLLTIFPSKVKSDVQLSCTFPWRQPP